MARERPQVLRAWLSQGKLAPQGVLEVPLDALQVLRERVQDRALPELFLARQEPPQEGLRADAPRSDVRRAHELPGHGRREHVRRDWRLWEFPVSRERRQEDAGRVAVAQL